MSSKFALGNCELTNQLTIILLEVYSERSQTSKTEIFVKLVNSKGTWGSRALGHSRHLSTWELEVLAH